MSTPIKLPELGENIDSGTVVKVLVEVGDEVKKDQPLIELETEKAVVEVPASQAGTIESIKVEEGATINVGDVIVELEGGEGGGEKDKEAEKKSKESEDKKKEEPKEKSKKKEEEKEEKEKGKEKDKEKEAAKQKKEEEPPEPEEKEEAEPEPEKEDAEPEPEAEEEPAEDEKPAKPEKKPAPRGKGGIIASPSTRRFAREIGIDIEHVPPADESGRVRIEDVKNYSKRINTDVMRQAHGPAAEAEPLPNFERWGKVNRHDMTTVRRRTGERMSYAWQTIPHVTHFDTADTTDLETMREQYGPAVEKAGGKLTVTAILVKVLASALKRFPQFNASIDFANHEIVNKEYCNVGVAVDTDRGLIVPVVHNVDKKNITEIAIEIGDLAERARNRKTKIDEMQGGCITITNLGGIGGTNFTPIINPPEVAILAVSRTTIEPRYVDGQFVPRHITPLGLSYDHRIIDGADAARFLRWVCQAIEQPFLLFLEG